MDDAAGSLVLAMAVELDELRRQLAEAQDLLVETAIDAGHLHAQIEGLQAELVEARCERDGWRARAERMRRAVTTDILQLSCTHRFALGGA